MAEEVVVEAVGVAEGEVAEAAAGVAAAEEEVAEGVKPKSRLRRHCCRHRHYRRQPHPLPRPTQLQSPRLATFSSDYSSTSRLRNNFFNYNGEKYSRRLMRD